MLEYSAPLVTESIGRLTYVWEALDLKVVADRITDAGTAELWFYHSNGNGDSLLHTAKANLLSTTTMSSIAKRMEHHSKDVPWTPVLTCISSKTMEYTRRGEPGFVIEPSVDEPHHPGYYIEPVIMKGVPNIWFGDKGVNKTTMALAALGLVTLGCCEGDIGLRSPDDAKCALLDWETGPAMTQYTVSRLIAGKTVPWFSLPYLRCRHSLIDEIDRIANFLHDNNTELVLIDSLGQAAGSGSKFDSSGKDTALRFFEALGQLNVTSLIIAQNAKSEEGKKSIFGSTYFTYYARNIFELRGKRDELDDNQMHIAMFHTDSNYSKRHEPMGFNLIYSDSTITVKSEEVSLATFIEKVTQYKAITEFLKVKSPQSRTAIASAIKKSIHHTDSVLGKMKDKGTVISLGGGMWALPTNQEEEIEDGDN